MDPILANITGLNWLQIRISGWLLKTAVESSLQKWLLLNSFIWRSRQYKTFWMSHSALPWNWSSVLISSWSSLILSQLELYVAREFTSFCSFASWARWICSPSLFRGFNKFKLVDYFYPSRIWIAKKPDPNIHRKSDPTGDDKNW